MNTFRIQTIFALVALAAVLNTAPASAMGNSGNKAAAKKPVSQAETQVQIEVLRKELA